MTLLSDIRPATQKHHIGDCLKPYQGEISTFANRRLSNLTKAIFSLSIVLMSCISFANTITVMNTNDTGTGSFRNAILSASSSDTIRFSPSLISSGSDTINLASVITFSTDLVIIGLYNSMDTLYISGQNTTRILSFQGANLVLDSLVFINGKSTNGGALYCYSGSIVNITNSLFRGNNATTKGGAIYAEFGDVNITNSAFYNNSATSDGGAIYSLSLQNFTTNNALFSGNTSGFTGGTLYLGGGSSSVFYLQKTTISYSTSAYDGAALYSKGRYFYMDSCIVNNNVATAGLLKSIVAFGGLNKMDIYVDNSEITNNTGLGIASHISLGVSVNTESKMYINRCTFDSNTLGGVYSEVFADNANSSSILEVNYSTVSNNGNASSTCGGVYSTAWGLGTGFSFNSNVKVKNSTIVNNSSSGNGSGVFSLGKLAASSYLEVKSCIVANNSGVNLLSFSTASSIASQGNNIFSHATVLGSVASDQLGVSAVSLNLGTLSNNGGFTRTLRPNSGSVAIDLGNISDLSNAQNGPISGRRDIGSTEWVECVKTFSYSQTICNGDSVLFNSIYRKTSGSYSQTYTVGPCDSIVTLNLTILPAITHSQTITLCAGESYSIGSSTYTTSGTYVDVLTAANGCDSTVTTNLTIRPAITHSQSITLCAGESYSIGSSTYTTSGTYVDVLTAANGCDSMVTTNLTIRPAIARSQTITLCAGESYSIGSSTYTSSGTYVDVLTAANGCDSMVTTNLTILPAIIHSQTITLCTGESYSIGSSTYTSSGTYVDVLTAANGCDSTVTTNLTIRPAITHSQSITLCAGESYSIGSSTYTSSGTYVDVLTAADGCDSTVTTNLTILPAIARSQTITLCAGESYSIGSSTYTSSGTYVDVLTAANGCDSTVTTNLTIRPAITHLQSITLCAGESYSIGSSTYTTSGTYVDILTAANGCDSTVTTNLTINSLIDISTTTLDQTISATQTGATYQWLDCDNANLPIPGEISQSYTALQNGNYAVVVTMNGCSDTSMCVIISTIELLELSNPAEIQLYPNPAISIFTVSGIDASATVSVFNSVGELIMVFQTSSSSVTIDLNENPDGIYFVKVSSNTTEKVLKLIKSNQ